MIALVKKLPKEIVDYLMEDEEPRKFSYFSERRLRPLTLLKSDKEKMKYFIGMLNN